MPSSSAGEPSNNQTEPRPMLSKRSPWFVRLRWLAPLVCVAVTGISAWFILRLKVDFSFEAIFSSDDPEAISYHRYLRDWQDDTAKLLLAIRAEQGTVYTVEAVSLVDQLAEEIRAIEGVKSADSLLDIVTVRGTEDGIVVGPVANRVPQNQAEVAALRKAVEDDPLLVGSYLSADGTMNAITIEIEGDRRTAEQRNPVVHQILSAAERTAAGSSFTPLLVGIPATQFAYSSRLTIDLVLFTVLGIILLAVTLGLVFRTFAGVLLPLSVVGMATAVTVGTMSAAGQAIDMITESIPILMLVIGVADGVHLIEHYRAKIIEGLPRVEAIRITLRELGKACVLTSLTTAVGFVSLMVARVHTVQVYGLYCALGLGYALIYNLVVVPVGLYVLNPRLPGMTRQSIHRNRLQHLLVTLAAWTQAKPWHALAAGGSFFLIAIVGLPYVKSDMRMFEEISDDDPLVRAHRQVEKHLPGANSYALDFTAGPGHTMVEPGTLQALDELSAMAHEHEAVSWSIGITDLIKQMHQASHDGDPLFYKIPEDSRLIAQYLLMLDGQMTDMVLSPDHRRAQIWLRGPEIYTSQWEALRRQLERRAAEMLPGTEMVVTGGCSVANRAMDGIVNDMMKSVAGAFVIILLMIGFLFKSVRLGLIAMVPNVLPLVNTLGFMGITGISLRTSTVVIFSVSLGLAVDDTIHFVVRYQRERARGLDVSEAVLRTMRGAGRAIVLTTVLLVGGFSIFLLSPFNAVKDIGLLGGVTLLSALVADLIILPAMLRLAPNVRAAAKRKRQGSEVGSQVGSRQLPVATPARDTRRAVG